MSRQRRILSLLQLIHGDFIAVDETAEIFQRLLDGVLEITDSEYGFIGETVLGENGNPILRTHALTNIAWNDEVRAMFESQMARGEGLVFENMDTLFGRVIRDEEMIVSNDIENDPRSAGWPEGHPPLRSFLGLPLKHAGRLVGMIGIANRPSGYDEMLIGELEAFQATAGTLLAARILARERAALEGRLAHSERLASLGRLAAGVAHEINNPLQYVLANLDDVKTALLGMALGRTEVPEWAREMVDALDDALEGVDRIRKVVKGLSQYSRPEIETNVAVCVQRVLERALAMTHYELRHRAVVERRGDDNVWVRGAETKLVQVFVNLIVNAAEAMSTKGGDGGRLELEVSSSQDEVVIRVSDTGAGIDPEHLPRIFDPFFTTKSTGHGSGLGMAICHGIITALEGQIYAESEVGVGTTVSVHLPRVDDLEGEQGWAQQVPQRRALVVDDDPLVAKVIGRALEPLARCVVCTDPRAALRRLEAGESFDVVVADLRMPGLGGLELYEAATYLQPELAERFIFVSGAIETEDRRTCAERRLTVLEKPFEGDELCARVRELWS